MHITPRLADLREALAGGMPPDGVELTFDLEERGPGPYLPDCLVISHRMCELVLRGVYDQVPDSVPIKELIE